MQPVVRPRTILLPRRALLSFIVFLFAAFLTLPALAEHIGPHRTTSTWVWERLACHYEAVYDPPGAGWYGCTLDLYGPPDSTCDSTSSVKSFFNSAACGWPAGFSCESLPCDISRTSGVESCSEGDEGCRAVEKTSSLPPATVAGSVSCGLPGSSDWCRGEAELSLSGSEPLAGYSILSLEGTRNGETFACSGSACSVTLVEGENGFSFWARSSYGDTSDMGSAAGSLDSHGPSLSAEVTGSAGDGGWYNSDVIVTAIAGDPSPGSGLANLESSVDGEGWVAYTGALNFSDGDHTVDLRASDLAGNTASVSQPVRVDTVPPDIDLSAGTSFCPGCGETLDVNVDVHDSGSSVVEWTLSADTTPIASGSGPVSQTISWDGASFGGGAHTLSLEARDAAGNNIDTSDPFDLIVPAPPPEQPSEDDSSGSVSQTIGLAVTQTTTPKPTSTPVLRPTRTPFTVPFGGLLAAPQPGSAEEGLPSGPLGSLSEPSSAASGGSSGALFGAAALALIATASAFTLERLRRRQAEEAALRLEMERRNAAAQAREDAQRAALAAAIAAKAAAQQMQQPFDLQVGPLEELLPTQERLAEPEGGTTTASDTERTESVDAERIAERRRLDNWRLIQSSATGIPETASPPVTGPALSPWMRALVGLAAPLVRLLPSIDLAQGSTGFDTFRWRTPGGLYEVGARGTASIGSSTGSGYTTNLEASRLSSGVSREGLPGFQVGIDEQSSTWFARIRGAAQEIQFADPGQASAQIAQSGSLSIHWQGLETTATAEFRPIDGSASYAGAKGRINYSVYVQWKPIKFGVTVIGATILVGGTILAIYFAPELVPGIGEAVRRLLPGPVPAFP